MKRIGTGTSIDLQGGGYTVHKMENRWTLSVCRSRTNVGQRWDYLRRRIERSGVSRFHQNPPLIAAQSDHQLLQSSLYTFLTFFPAALDVDSFHHCVRYQNQGVSLGTR